MEMNLKLSEIRRNRTKATTKLRKKMNNERIEISQENAEKKLFKVDTIFALISCYETCIHEKIERKL
jgi:hypothetical protein